MKIAIVVGSLSKDSINKKLAKNLIDEFATEIDFDIIDLSVFPLYSSDSDNNYPEKVKNEKEKIRESDAVLIITPEYNRSIPGVLKNSLDVLSRPVSDGNVFFHKKVAVMGVSPGRLGTALGQQHLKNVLQFFGADIFNREMYLKYDDIFEGDLLNQTASNMIREFVDEFKKVINQ